MHGVSQKTGFGTKFRTAESSHAICCKLELLWRKLKASTPCDTHGELNLTSPDLQVSRAQWKLWSRFIFIPQHVHYSKVFFTKGDWGWNPITADTFLLSSVQSVPYSLNFLFKEHRGQSGQDEKVTIYRHLILKFRMPGDISPLSHASSYGVS